ncbi:NAD(P)H-dependent glycerol-3-phosphate dehydrogenase [Clostridium luticellarii]|uniref:Glycerol-3-phosphate dehydrogenase [NAD(P)+] n=1 Tax=Clostridium luticellarii TaxID=1691940 RepID=A0A2T0BRE7_9CLOT|nr:NAD(P)H-dependent glycerol-3-phosphate dehydrogenase [Clostridium luticellarii]MCI1943847.1 NAD(P)H-dependent glycerol-3-phosphate dehydrogenase [Clostridium luticellarii]MCI1967108.1 NAD(P)H-dependent glycerol-3-phosphate dehydrogenase [Clostridium luticellarii]MCI1994475.1 NAD(P)H-dependent glycerol-3-phosphate dehydrogenase [Clostridium luticellarii]MCI2038572.1 NAD(P)H-dependent glycerol-3-phosphate dehydrogenase [Clostridium luticellarii]PRR86446.1 Glycerol-3-phosphate dehydrogenase [C
MGLSVSFLGGGSFGTALSVMLAKKGVQVNLWDRKSTIVEDINVKRENIKYLHKVLIPKGVKASTDGEKVIKSSDILVLAVPSQAVREVCGNFSQFIDKDQIIVNIAKGIETKTGERLSQVIEEELPENKVVVLSGPSHAEEVALDIPTTVVVSSKDMEACRKIQNLFMTNKFRVYTNEDTVGVEIGGAVKNIIALAAGISDGIGYGDNSKAALMTRGIAEIVRIGERLGGRRETFSGLSGIGDLIVTCTSMHSRNRKAGILIGQGKSVKEAVKQVNMVVEGISACQAFHELKSKLNVEMPITEALYEILFLGKDPRYTVYELMTRAKKSEVY